MAAVSVMEGRMAALAEQGLLDRTELRISPRGQSRYGAVVATMAAAQRIGVRSLVFAGGEDLPTAVSCSPPI